MNIQTKPCIRQALQSDAADLAVLINLAGEGIPVWLWTRACVEGQTPFEVGTERARRRSGGFSYSSALVAETDGHISGMVLSYAISKAPDGDPDDVPAPIAPFIALEKHSAGTWYINALAVRPAAQSTGLGTQLLAAAEGLAAENGFGEMSIQVYEQNSGALRLYRRIGYEIAARAPVRLHPCPPYYTGDVLLLKKRLAR